MFRQLEILHYPYCSLDCVCIYTRLNFSNLSIHVEESEIAETKYKIQNEICIDIIYLKL